MILAERDRAASRRWAGRPSIMIVDDDPSALAALKRAFRKEPYDLLATDQPLQALDWAEDRDVNLVLCDEFMPEMLGTRLLEEIRGRCPGAAGVIITGYLNPLVTFRSFKSRVDLLLSKPWDDEELRGAVRRLIEERRPIDLRNDPKEEGDLGGEAG